MQDTFVMLIERGHSPGWLEDLDMCQFEALAESSQRMDARRRVTEFSDGRMIAHAEGKKVEEYLRPLKSASKIQSTAAAGNDATALMRAQR